MAEEKPEGVENEAVEQVCFADKILLNKVDLADNASLAKIEKELRKLNPTTSIQRTKNANIKPKDVLNLQAFELKRVLDFDPEFLDEDAEHEHDSRVSSISVKVEGEVNMMMLQTWIQRLVVEDGANLYRYKGIIAVKNIPQKFVFQGVGMLFDGDFDQDVVWKKGEKRESRFVFIGKNLDKQLYREGFMACQTNQELRFDLGAEVEANVGKWEKGIVIEQWDQGNAYRIELENEAKTNVWAPVDIDQYVRVRGAGSKKRQLEQVSK